MEEVVEEIAEHLGLTRVGWIFTDLVPAAGGKVKYFRGVDTHFLSAQEIITAGHYQNVKPNVCKMTDEGTFGSKFVPDVFFMEKDKYGNEIKKVGRPLPVEYLLIDVPVSSPLEPLATFALLGEDRKPFPIENRLLESSIQDFNAFARYISQFRSAEFLDSVSDLHVLVFMATTDVIPLRHFMGPLYEAIRCKSLEAAREWSYLDHWANMQALIQATTMN